MLPCAWPNIPPGKLTSNQVGVLVLDYDSALAVCDARGRKLVEFIKAGEQPTK